MSFLNPLYLLAALAALVPLIIHLLHRQRARIEVFPSLEFLRRMMRRKTRRFHLKQILLLLARILLVLFIALALARPTVTGGRVVKGHLPTSAVIILDDSFSMLRRSGEQELFDLAKLKTLSLLEYFERSDEVYILAASSPSHGLVESGATDPDRLGERVGEITCGRFKTDIAAPLRQALAILEDSDNPNKEIYIISDMQQAGWDWEEEAGAGEHEGIKVMVVDLGDEDANACVSDVAFRIPAGTDDLEMAVTFERFHSPGNQGRVAEIFLKGALFERTVFSPGEFAGEEETFRIPAFDGFFWGEVAMAADKLEIDDKRYFALPSRRRVIGVVGEHYYIENALSPMGGGGFQPVVIEEGALNRESLAGIDVLVAANVQRFSPLEIEAIADYVAGGGGLLMFLGDRVDIGAYNRHLLPRLGPVTIESVADGGETGFYSIERFERGHPVFAKFKTDESPFSDARFYQYMRLGAGGGRAIAHFSDGSPAVVEVNERFVIFASSADTRWSDLVSTSQFLPILHEMLLYLSSHIRLSQSYEIGSEILIKAAGAEAPVILDGPTGAVRHFPEVLGETRRYRIESPAEPGIYFLRSERETLSVFAVNVDPRESDLTKVPFDQIRSALAGLDVRRISAEDDIGASISLLRRGRDLARACLWAGLVLVIIESLLASNLSLPWRKTEEEDAFTHS
jgi:hypothetical protein